MGIYYFANQVYQFSHIMPLYRRAKGVFVLKKHKRLWEFKKHFKNGNATPGVKTFFNTPPSIIKNANNLTGLQGVIVSVSNAWLKRDVHKCKTIFVGHGSGDKKYDDQEQLISEYNYIFLTGEKYRQKLIDVGLAIPENRLIKIGNMRFDDYLNGKFDREQELNRLGIVDRSRKNILFAPTWKWGNGTLMKYSYRFAEEITREHNLIIRPHSHETKYLPQIKRWAEKNKIEHLYFSNPTNVVTSDTMNDFAVSDLMISDVSSILYEYLVTRKPIIVVKNNYDNLHAMPDGMNIMKHVSIFEEQDTMVNLINQNLSNERLSDMFNEILHTCFYFNDGKSIDRAKEFITSIL